MQQMSTEEEEEIEYAICMESGAIQPKTVGKEREEKKKIVEQLQESAKDNGEQ